MKSKILFISHNATRTGAPIELLRFLKWMKKSSDDPFIVLLEEGGEMESDFADIAPTLVWKRPLTSKISIVKMMQEIFRYEGIRNLLKGFLIKIRLSFSNISLIYANTVFVGDSFRLIKKKKHHSICRVHESEPSIREFRSPTGYRSFKYLSRVCEHFIAVSGSVRDNLVNNHNISSNKVSVIHGSIEHFDTENYISTESILQIKRELDIPENSFVIGAAGWIQHGKGPDIFIKIAENIKKRLKGMNIFFVWVGGGKDLELYKKLEKYIKNSEFNSSFRFIGHKEDPYPYYSIFNILALTSRSDSFPLVNIEAGILGKPVICFHGSGGSTEWAESGCGYCVPYLDINAFAEKVIHLIEHPDELSGLSQICKKNAEAFTTEKTGPKIYNTLQKVIKKI